MKLDDWPPGQRARGLLVPHPITMGCAAPASLSGAIGTTSRRARGPVRRAAGERHEAVHGLGIGADRDLRTEAPGDAADLRLDESCEEGMSCFCCGGVGLPWLTGGAGHVPAVHHDLGG